MDKQLQSFIDALKLISEVKSVSVTDAVPKHLIDQVPVKENLLMFSFVLDIGDKDNVEADFVIVKDLINEKSSESFKTGLEGMIDCDCVRLSHDQTDIHYNPFFNSGKNVFWIRPDTQYIDRLKDKIPTRVEPNTPQLRTLIEKLKAVEHVTDVYLEEIVDKDGIINDAGGWDSADSDHVMVCAIVENKLGPSESHFAIPESAYANEFNMQWAVDNLKEIVSKQI